MEADERLLKASAFLVQALDLGDDPAVAASDLMPVDQDPAVAVFAAELESSIGPAAFLIYAYSLAATDAAGRTGRDRFAADLATLQTAAERDVPGPRAVAHALTDTDGFILATTPATLRALSGETPLETLEAGPADLLPAGDPSAARAAAAAELLRLLRLANAQAASWLAAVEATKRIGATADAPASKGLAYTAEETELTLFLLDNRARDLFRALDALLSDARNRTPGGTNQDA